MRTPTPKDNGQKPKSRELRGGRMNTLGASRNQAIATEKKSPGQRQLFALLPMFMAVLGLAICCSNACAQSQSGLSTVQGTITDSSGAVMRDASIHIVNNA